MRLIGWPLPVRRADFGAIVRRWPRLRSDGARPISASPSPVRVAVDQRAHADDLGDQPADGVRPLPHLAARHHRKPLDLQVDSKAYPAFMATTMRIAEVANRSGFSPATLRYYEQLDLLPEPQRTAAGYRAYDESVLARLDFIARAKTLGCSLEEIAELMPHWDGGQCAPVQDRLRELVTAKLSDTQARVAELEAFTADLRRIRVDLDSHTPDGPCDSHCGCLSDSSTTSTPGTPWPPSPRPWPAGSRRLRCRHDCRSDVIWSPTWSTGQPSTGVPASSSTPRPRSTRWPYS